MGFLTIARTARLAFGKVVKTADEVVSDSGVLQDDDELLMPLNINKNYGFIFVFSLTSSAVADFLYTLSGPAGSVVGWNFTSGSDRFTSQQVLAGSGNRAGMILFGSIEMGATSGNLQLEWAQNTGEVSNTTVHKGSFLVVWED